MERYVKIVLAFSRCFWKKVLSLMFEKVLNATLFQFQIAI